MSDAHEMSSKALLRKEMKLILKNLPKNEKDRQSVVVAEKVFEHPSFRKADSVSIYLNMEDEIQTGSLVFEIFQQGKKCFIPRFQSGSYSMEMVKLASFDNYLNLPRNKWNIPQPPESEILESVFEKNKLDLILTPGLAFTRDGLRLGRGKGYYDRFFAKCDKELNEPPIKIGLAFKEQIFTSIPTTENDVRLDFVLSAEDL